MMLRFRFHFQKEESFMPDDPIFGDDELRYESALSDADDSQIMCCICGNLEAKYDEQREEYICDACLHRYDNAWKDAEARREQAIADAFNAAVEEHFQIDERRRMRR